MNPDQSVPAVGRTERKRGSVIDEATALFLRNGFSGTSMDQIAAAASVSKQTVYKQFGSKEQLFRDIVGGVTSNSDAIVATVTTAFGAGPATSLAELEKRLAKLARAYLDRVLEAHVLSLRRLIIAEADRFPDLAATYFAQGPSRGIATIAECLAPHVESGILTTGDLNTAATQFAYLALAPAQDRALFLPGTLPTGAERTRLAKAAAATFVAAFGAARVSITGAKGGPS